MPELIEPVLPTPAEENVVPVAVESAPLEPVVEPPAPPVVEQPAAVEPALQVWSPAETRLSSPVSSTPRSRRRLPVSLWFMALLVPYAIVSTIAVAYLLQQQLRNKAPHILESIPDQGLYEDFLDGRRREVIPSVTKVQEKPGVTKIIPPNEPISQEIPPLKIGETRKVGQLEVTPLGITKQKLAYALKAGRSDVEGEEALVLKLQVKNVGSIIFRPDDETFNRSVPNESKAPVYTFLETGVEPKVERYFGAISDPLTERLSHPMCGSLLPGEVGLMHIVAVKNSDGKKSVVGALEEKGLLVWRVHLRRGKEEITLSTGKKRSVWLTTVVPISFTAAEVK